MRGLSGASLKRVLGYVLYTTLLHIGSGENIRQAEWLAENALLVKINGDLHLSGS